MTITYTPELMRIESDIINNYISTPNATLTLTSDLNCCGNLITIDITTQLAGNLIELSVADLEQEGTFVDGIYNFTLRMTEEDGSYTEEVDCQFVDITTSCDIALWLTTNTDTATLVPFTYEALQQLPECDSCGCPTMCELYRQLLQELGTTITPTNDCGCN